MRKAFINTALHFLAFVIAVGLFQMTSGIIARAEEDSGADYQIRVNRAANCITVYERDNSGVFSIPVRVFLCSTGRSLSYTPLGTYSTSSYYRWHEMFGGSYTQYAVRINNHIMLHSIPYNSANPGSMSWEQYNLLGERASMGCIRLACADAKWIYDNCRPGTEVVIYDDTENPGPLGKPEAMKISADNPSRRWDPTDLSENNPWNKVRPLIYLKDDIGDGMLYIPLGAGIDSVKNRLGMKNADGISYNTDEYSVNIYGNYDLNKAGVYKIYISGIEKQTGMTAGKEVIMYVLENMIEI